MKVVLSHPSSLPLFFLFPFLYSAFCNLHPDEWSNKNDDSYN
ncbi:hypothetical protein EH2_03394 [Bacillus subtilis]|nr:hypothetical protein EH2_03394 [Bacillus subtilis]